MAADGKSWINTTEICLVYIIYPSPPEINKDKVVGVMAKTETKVMGCCQLTGDSKIEIPYHFPAVS